MILPSLELLGLGDFPQWDIYMIMLKRRNVTGVKGISSIETLELSPQIPKELIQPIVHLLQGKLPAPIYFFDFSIHGALELVKDMSIPGCHRCLHSFRPCTEEPTTEALDWSPIFLYPSDEDDILSSWEERNRVWKEEVIPFIARKEQCGGGIFSSGKKVLTRESSLDFQSPRVCYYPVGCS
ncbi:hypothetical protein CPB86DRAFT_757032 [Serendipita vermifera]|nr:hypothetical protein CPB86DRAFT_757032 [Serendipita vermifera]